MPDVQSTKKQLHMQQWAAIIEDRIASGLKIGPMSIPWTQKVELFSQHSICREIYFLCCQSLIFNLLWCLVLASSNV